GDEVFSAGLGSDIDVVSLAAGSYTLLLEGRYYNTAASAYQFTVQPVADESAALTLGQRVDGAIAHAGQTDRYSFTLTEAKRLYFDGLTDTASIFWTLTGPRGVVTGEREIRFSDGWEIGSGNPLLALAPGDYVVTVDGSGAATGTYAFRLLDFAEAAPFTPGTPVSGQLSPGAESDLYRFEVPEGGGRYYFDMLSVSNGDSSWRLINPYGDQVFMQGLGSDLDVTTLLTPGTYTLILEGRRYQSAPNNYQFNVQPVSDDTVALALGQRVDGTIAHPGQVDRYSFTLAEAQRLYFDALTDTPSIHWTLSGPRGVVVSNREIRFSDTWDFGSSSPTLALVPGDYVVTVDVPGATTGTYAFRLLDMAGAAPITPGTAVTGQLNPGNESDLYRFEVPEGGARYYFDMRSIGNSDSSWRLINPYGDPVFMTGLGSDVDATLLSIPGTYTLILEGRRYQSAANNYQFTVHPLPEVAPVELSGLENVPGPDLEVAALAVSAAGGVIQSGATLTVRWEDRNGGDRDAAAGWRDRVLVRNLGTNELIANVLLPYEAGAEALAPGASLAREVTLTLPEGLSGAGQLRVTVSTDVDNAVTEHNADDSAEANNDAVLVVTSALAPYPDLVTSGLTVEPPGAWAPGSSVTLRWTVQNAGTRATSGAWHDTVQVLNLATGQTVFAQAVPDEAGPLAPGASRERSVALTWPAGGAANGRFQFSVSLDSGSALTEVNTGGTGETNNFAQLTVASAPDVQVAALRIDQASVAAGDLVTVRWDIVNGGTRPVGAAFADRVVVVNSRTGETLVDAQVPAFAAIEPGASLARSFAFRMPEGARGVGAITVSVTADRANALVEANEANTAEANNTAGFGFTSGSRSYADLTVSVVDAPAQARGGEPFLVTWTVLNQGGAAAA
ncbi:MAG TPA: CARDB domain-containing protein, partial [Candidatus Limnocylindrales bacterium]